MAKKSANINPNEGLGLERFDYKKLEGQHFEDYQEIVSKLQLQEKYDFEIWKATSIVKFRMNADTGDKEAYIDGIKLNSADPVQKTRIKAMDALEINKHVSHLKGNEITSTSKYCLLAKPVSETIPA
jgi:hypothetical protein